MIEAQCLDALIDQHLDSTLTSQGKTELERMLLTSPEARDIYWERVRLHALLRENGASEVGRHVLATFATAGASNASSDVPAPLPILSLGRPVLRYAVAAALVMAVGITISALMSMSSQNLYVPGTRVAVATLVAATDARFDTSDVATEVGSQLSTGFIRLRAGTAQIRFRSGAMVTLEGPAEFGLNSEMRGFLVSGKLLAFVPPAAHGFTVGAKGVSVIDLGTEFGMVADSSGAQVHVLTGRVNIMTDGDARELRVGNACAVSPVGVIREIGIEPQIFDRQIVAAAMDTSLIPHAVARQSSGYESNSRLNAQNAIDANPLTYSHTHINDANPWFELSLENASFIRKVSICNRLDCCGARMRDIFIEVLDAGGNVVYRSELLNPDNMLGEGPGYLRNEGQVAMLEVAPGVVGAAIRVRRVPDPQANPTDNRNILSLGEIEVIGHAVIDQGGD